MYNKTKNKSGFVLIMLLLLSFFASINFFVMPVYATIQAVAGQSHPLLIEGSYTNTISGNLAQGPVQGDVLIAAIAMRDNSYGGNHILSITQTGVVWTHVVSTVGLYAVYQATAEIWKGLAIGVSPGVSIIILSSASESELMARICEYSGLSGDVDVTAYANSGTGYSGTADSGTTATTTVANELWVAGFSLCSGATVSSGPTNGFTGYYDAAYYGGGTINAYCENIVSSTGTADTSLDASSIWVWAGVIATFKEGAIALYDLTVHSNVAVDVHIDTVDVGNTPVTISGVAGSHTIEIPVASGSYTFSNWEDNSIDRVRVVDLEAATIYTATYAISPIQPVAGQSHPLLIEGLSTDTINGNLAQTPAEGNLLVAVITIRDVSVPSPNPVTAITQTNVMWTHIITADANYVAYKTHAEIWKGVIDAGASVGITITVTYSSSAIMARVCEYSGLSGDVDKTASNSSGTGYSGTADSGTTATTTVANELWISGLSLFSGATIISGPIHGFTGYYDTSYYDNGMVNCYAEKTVFLTGIANTEVTGSGDWVWAGAIACFEAASVGDSTPPTYSSISTNATIRNTVCSFNVTLADETALGGYIFGTNNTGTWINDSLVTISGVSYNASTTKTLNDTVGFIIQWEYWFNDSSNNINNTGIQSLTTTLLAQVSAMSQTIASSWSMLNTLAAKVGLSRTITSLWSLSPKWTSAATLSRTISSGWNVATEWISSVGLSRSITASWNVATHWATNIRISQSITSAWNVLTTWTSKVSLSQSIASAWNVLAMWTSNVGLSQPITTAWSVATHWIANAEASFSTSTSWLTIVTQSTVHNLVAALSASASTSWNTVVEWTAAVGISQSISTSLHALNHWTANVGTTVSVSATDAIDALQNTAHQYYVSLSTALSTSWNVIVNQVSHSGASIGGSIMAVGIVLLFILTPALLIFVVVLRRRH